MDELDPVWKEALDSFFESCLALLFPDMHHDIDWTRPWEDLDRELERLFPQAEMGPRRVDKLVKVWLRNGEASWILLHLEVQAEAREDFARRMFVYHFSLYARYDRAVVSAAILADDSPNWRPGGYGYSRWGCSLAFQYRTVKLLDLRSRSEELARSANPFARFVLAHLHTLDTRRDPAQRQGWKIRLVKELYGQGFTSEEIRSLFNLIDALMRLPDDFEQDFLHELTRFEEENAMPFVAPWERLTLEKGRQEGRQEGLHLAIRSLISQRFGQEGLELMPEVEQLKDEVRLRAILSALGRFDVNSLDAIRALLRP